MHKQTQRLHRTFTGHNHRYTLVLLLATLSLLTGCTPPLPVVQLSQSGFHDNLATNKDIYLSQVVVIVDDLPVASQEVERLVRQKLTDLLAAPNEPLNEPRPSASGPYSTLNKMSLSCYVKASRSITLTEPLPAGFWISMRFDLTQPLSDRIEKSLNFEYLSSSGRSMTLKQCLSNWLEQLADVLRSSPIRHRYHLARGLSNDDRRGRKRVEQGNYPEALRSFQKAIDAHPDDHAALYNAGLMCEALEKYQRALNYYQRAYRISAKQDYQAAVNRIEKALP